MRHTRRSTTGRMLLFTLITAFLAQADESLLRVRTLALEDGDMPAWYVAVGDQQFEKLEWPTAQPSVAVAARAGQELSLYSKETAQGGEPQFKLARKVAIPGAADEVLLLGWPAIDGGEADLIAIADNYTKADFSDWLVINRSDHAVTLRYGRGNEPIALEAGEAKTYRIGGERDKGGEAIAEAMIGGEMRKIYSTFWGAPAKQRSLVLFSGKDGGVKVRKIIDFLPKDQEEDPN